MCIAVIALDVSAVVRRWSGGGTNTRFGNGANWVGGTAPATTDDAQFDSSSKNCDLNAATSINNITFTSGYKGTFGFSNRTLSVTGNADFSTGGSISAGTGTLQFTGTSAQNFTPLASATFPAITQNGAGGTTILADLSAGALTAANGELNLGTGRTIQVTSVGSANPSTGSINFGTSVLKVSGAANFGSVSVNPGSSGARLIFTLAGTQAFTPKAGSIFPDIEQNGSSGTTTVGTRGFKGNQLIITAGTFALGGGLSDTVTRFTGTAGTLNFGTGTLAVTGDSANFKNLTQVTQSMGTLQFTGAGTQVLVPRLNDTLPNVVHAGSGILQLSTNLLKSLSFANSAGKIDFNGINVTTVTTGNFTVSTGDSATMVNLTGRTITVAGATSFAGQNGNLLNLNPGSRWEIASTGALSADRARLAFSKAMITKGTTTNCADLGNDSNWTFVNAKTWVGTSANGKWSNPANWSNGALPTSVDTIKFDATSSASCTLDVSDTVASIIFVAGYTGSFNFSSSILRVLNVSDFRSGGVFVAGTGTLEFAPSGAMTFYPNTSTGFPSLVQNGSGTTMISGTLASAASLIMKTGTFALGSAGLTHTIGTVSGTGGTLDFGTSILQLSGTSLDFSAFAITPGTGTLVFTGTSQQTFTPHASDTFPAVTQNGSGGTLLAADLIAGALSVNQGEFNLGSGRTHWVPSIASAAPNTGSINFSSSTLRVTTGNATFTSIAVVPGNGRLVFTRAGAQSFTPRAGSVFPDIEQNGTGGTTTVGTRGFNGGKLIMSGGTFALGAFSDTVTSVTGTAGTLTFATTTTLLVTGDSANFGGLTQVTQSTGTLKLTGSGTQVLVPRLNDTLPNVVHAGSGTLQLSTNLLRSISFANSAGKLDFNGINITTVATGNFTISTGDSTTMIGLAGRRITVAGVTSFGGQNGNLLNLNPASRWEIASTGVLSADRARLGFSKAMVRQGTTTNCADMGNDSNWIFTNAKSWVGTASNGKWSNPFNWSDGVLPTALDTIKFSATSVANCTLDISDTVASVVFVAGYTGTFNFSSNTLRVLNVPDFRSGGVFVAGTGTLEFAPSGAMTFYPNTSTGFPSLVQNGSSTTTISGTLASAASLIIKTGTFALGSAGATHTIGTVSGTGGTLDFGTSILQLNGTSVDFSSIAINPGGTLVFTGTSQQTFTPHASDTFPAVTQNGSGGTLLAADLIAGALSVNQGEFNLGTGWTHLVPSITSAAPGTGSINFGSSILRVTTGNATFTSIAVTPGAGRLVFARNGAQTFTPNAGSVFPDIEQTGTGTMTVGTRGFNGGKLIISAGTVDMGALSDTVTGVTGIGVLDIGTGTLVVTGDSANFGNLSQLALMTASLRLTGSGTQILVPHPVDDMPNIYHTGTGTLRLSGNPLSALSFTNSAGKLDFNGLNITTLSKGNFAVSFGDSATMIGLGGRTITVAGATSFAGQNGNLLNLNPGSRWEINSNGALTADRARLAYSKATGSTGTATNCADLGNDSNWTFNNAKTWVGTVSNGKWSDAANWSNGILPIATDTVNFNAASVASCTLDISDTVAGIILSVAYTGSFNFSGSTLRVLNTPDFRSGGVFVPGTGTLEFAPSGAMTFYPNTSTGFPSLVQNGSGTTTISGTLASAASLIINSGTFALGSAGATHTIGNVSGTGGTLSFGTSILQLNGTSLDFSAIAINPGGTLVFNGTAQQTFTPHASDTFPAVTQNGSGGTLLAADLIAGALSVNQGEFNLGSGRTHWVPSITSAAPNSGSINFGSSMLRVTTGNATFTSIAVTPGTGRLVFTRAGAQTFTPRAGSIFPDIEQNGTGGTTTVGTRGFNGGKLIMSAGTFALAFSDTVMSINGAAGTLDFGTAAVAVTGDTAYFGGLSQVTAGGSLHFTGNGTQVLIPRNNDTLPAIMHSGTGILQLASAGLNTPGFAQTAGKLNFGGRNITTVGGGDFSITNGDSLTLTGLENRLISVTGNAILNGQTGNRLNLDASAPWTIDVYGTLTADWAEIGNSNASRTPGVATNSITRGDNLSWTFVNPKIWTNMAGDSLWSNPDNWADGKVPANADTVRFTGDYLDNCILTISDTVTAAVFSPLYTGRFNFSSNILSITGDADCQSGGTFAGTTGALRFIGASPQNFSPASASFPGIVQTGAGGLRVNGVLTANVFSISSGTATLTGSYKHTIGRLTGNGSLVFNACTLQVSGDTADFSAMSINAGTGVLAFIGSSRQYFKPENTVGMPVIIQNGAGGTTMLADLLAGTLTIANGEFDLGSGMTHTVASIGSAAPNTGSINFNASTLQVTGNAALTGVAIAAGTGKLGFAGSGAQSFTPRAGAVFPEIAQTGTGTTTVATRGFKSSKLTVAGGTFEIGDGRSDTVSDFRSSAGTLNFGTGTLVVTGDTAHFGGLSQVAAGGGSLQFVGSGTQVCIPRTGDTLPAITHSGSGTLMLAGSVLKAASFSQNAGKLDFNGQDLTTAGDFSITNGDSLTIIGLGDRIITVAGVASMSGQSGNLLNLDPGSVWNIDVPTDLTADYARIANSHANTAMGYGIRSVEGLGNLNWNIRGIDSLMVAGVADLMPTDTLWELQANVPALRVVFRHPESSGDVRKVTRIDFTIAPSVPSSVIGRKSIRRKGSALDHYSSTSIEGGNPLVFNLASAPIYVHPGDIDTYDIHFDVAADPGDTVKFTLDNELAVFAEDSATGNPVEMKPDMGMAFPASSSVGRINGGPATPSGKIIDGSLADWSISERLDQYNGSESFYATWDKSSFYFAWSGTNLSAGDLFLYISTATTGDSMTWNYGGGNHKIDSTFRKARYLYYYDDASNNGLRDGTNGYGELAFNGEVASSGTVTEIRIPFTDLGSPDSIRIIPFIQQEGGSDILVSLPHDAVSEFVRNPVGKASQKFISCLRLNRTTQGQTPAAVTKIDSATTIKPTWTYPLQPSGSHATSLTIGYRDLYVSVAGSENKLTCLNANGTVNWETATFGSPVTSVATYTMPSGTNVVLFCEGNNFRAFYDNAGSCQELSYSPINLGSRGGNPSRSFPPDGGSLDTVFAYVPCENGKIYKIRVDEDDGGFIYDSTADISASPDAGVAVAGDRVIVGCTDGRLYSFSFDAQKRFGASINGDVGDSINQKITYTSGLATIYCTPKGNYLVARKAADLSPKWSYDMGGLIHAGAYVYTSVKPHQLFCPVEDSMKYVRDDTTHGHWFWTRPTTGTISTDPVMSSSVVYFSSDDKRNFAVNAGTGAVRNGWPTAVFSQAGRTRIAVDGTTSSVYFGGGDGKIYRYPKQ
jgi:hypothetical protein